jgi:glycosyltransferase involved in cell wall biosynthesis
VGLTEIEAEHLRARGVRGEVPVIPNGVAPAPAKIDCTALRRELGLEARDPLALFVGRLDVYRKGLDALLAGIAQANTWTLALVGPDFRDGVRRLGALIDELSLGDQVRLLGERHDERLHEAYSGADLLVLPSRWEGLSMALLEGMAHGLPALVSPTVEIALGIQTAGAGWSAPHDDLGSALVRLASLEREVWAETKRAAREFAERFGWDDVAEKYERVYAAAARAQQAGL